MSPVIPLDKFISNHAILMLKGIKKYENWSAKKTRKLITYNKGHFDTVQLKDPQIVSWSFIMNLNSEFTWIKGGSRGGDLGSGPPLEFWQKVVIRFVIGTGLILHRIYVNYSHKSKKGSKCGYLMVRTWNVDFSCIQLTPTEIRKSKVSHNKTSAFSVGPPLRKISGSVHVDTCQNQ